MPGADARPVVIGHRGASADAPENTIAAFELALEQGADAKGAARDLAHRVHAVVAAALPAHQRPDAPGDAPA